MANKITIQHYYTTGSTNAPTGLIAGEIAISHVQNNEAIYLKDGVKFIPKTQIDELISAATSGLATDVNISALSTDLNTHKNLKGNENAGSTPIFGHVTLRSGDISGITKSTSGYAASDYHTHGQYLTGVTADSGQPIVSLIENGVAKIGLTTGITSQISSGVTAYGWGNHADIGYAKNSDLTSHTGNTDIHVTTGDKEKWNSAATAVTTSAETWNETTTKVNASASTWNTAAERINTFMDSEKIEGAVDTLKEIQQFLDGTGSTVQTLLDNLDVLTTDVENNTTAITKNTNNITTISGNVNTISGRVDTLSTNLENVFTNFTHSITGTGSNIKVEKKGVTEKSYEISHTPASTQASAITVTNSNEVISFGSTFDIVNKIAYDANGHVVSGTTQTLKLPTIQTATTNNYGIVKLKSGELTLEDELLKNEDYSRTAAGVAHGHTEYVKLTDLYSGNTSSNITISCGTY